MSTTAQRLGAAAVVIVIAAGFGILSITGHTSGETELGAFEPRGVISAAPGAIVSIDIHGSKGNAGFHRSESGASLTDGGNEAVPPELAVHLHDAVTFLHASEPIRTFHADELLGSKFSKFGLDPPALRVSLTFTDGSDTVVNFGALNAASTSQYVRIVGQPLLHLLSRHVGSEWEVAYDLSQRLTPVAKGGEDVRVGKHWLLSASIDRIWAVEIVVQGKLHRLERDAAGNWLLHQGQHDHSVGAPVHVADPAQAQTIALTFSALDQAQVEGSLPKAATGSSLQEFGLDRPKIIALFYARDNSSPLIRLEVGKMADDGFTQYAHVNRSEDVVKVASYQVNGLIDLLKNLGALS